jgi:hypothetical protein
VFIRSEDGVRTVRAMVDTAATITNQPSTGNRAGPPPAPTDDAAAFDLEDASFFYGSFRAVDAARMTIADPATGARRGLLVEVADTGSLLASPSDQRTEDYITGRFG